MHPLVGLQVGGSALALGRDQSSASTSWYAARAGVRLRLVEIAKKPDDISRVLGDVGDARAPPRAPPRAERLAHGQLRLAFG